MSMLQPNPTVFVTGASGYIGSSIASHLIRHGYRVRGLTRRAETEWELRRLGVEPVIGDLDEADLLGEEAWRADVVINTADSDHFGAVEALIGALSGTGKTLIHSSGSNVVGDDVEGESMSSAIYADDTPFTPMKVRKDRVAINQTVRRASIERAPAAVSMYAENGEASYGQLALTISVALGFKGRIQSWSFADAETEFGDWARFAIAFNSRVRSTHARRLLGWKPNAPSVLEWIRESVRPETADVELESADRAFDTSLG